MFSHNEKYFFESQIRPLTKRIVVHRAAEDVMYTFKIGVIFYCSRRYIQKKNFAVGII